MIADDLAAYGASQATEITGPPRSALYVRLCRGLAVVVDDDGVIVDGGPRRHHLTGAAAAQLVTKLIPLLDGRRTIGEIADFVGRTEEVNRAIALLRLADLVEYSDSPFGAGHGLAREHAAEFLSRAVHGTGAYRNSAELLEALAGSKVLVLAGARVGEALCADLRDCGVGKVITIGVSDPAAVSAAIGDIAGSPRPVVAAVEDDTLAPALTLAEAVCRQRGVPVLRAGRRGAVIELGPLFYPDQTACLACFRRGRTDFLGARTAEPHNGMASPGPLEQAADQALAAMLAEEVLAMLGSVRIPRTVRTMVMSSLTDGTEQRLLVLPYPECTVCGPLFPSSTPADDAAAYEWDLQLTPPWLAPSGPATALLQPHIADLATSRPRFLPGPSYDLPDATETEPCAAAGLPATTRLDLTVLAGIVARVAGRRQPGHPTDLSRWSPSAGNLASTFLYVVASGTGLGPIAGSLLRYDDMAHRLAKVRARPVSPEKLLDRTGLSAQEECAVVVFVADIARIGRKYRNSYRLAHLDAGVAATQLAVVAGQMALRVRFASAWDSQLADVLELRTDEETVTALALITPGGTTDATGP